MPFLIKLLSTSIPLKPNFDVCNMIFSGSLFLRIGTSLLIKKSLIDSASSIRDYNFFSSLASNSPLIELSHEAKNKELGLEV